MARAFKVVGPDDESEGDGIVSVFDAGERGSRMDELVQIRRIIARALDEPSTPARELAPLTRRYSEVSNEIESLRSEWAEEARDSEVSDDEKFSASAI